MQYVSERIKMFQCLLLLAEVSSGLDNKINTYVHVGPCPTRDTLNMRPTLAVPVSLRRNGIVAKVWNTIFRSVCGRQRPKLDAVPRMQVQPSA